MNEQKNYPPKDTASNQMELDKLIAEGVKEIYLCKNQFEISLEYEKITYHGIDSPIVLVKAEDNVDFKSKNIQFIDILFGWDVSNITEVDEVYQAEQLMMKNEWQKAVPILQKYSEMSHPRAILLLERIYCSYNFADTGIHDFRKIYDEMGIALGSVHSFVMGNQNGFEPYFPILKLLADKGNPLDQCLYSFALRKECKENRSFNCSRNCEITRYLAMAEEKGCLWATHLIAINYMNGYSVRRNKDIALIKLKRASDKGFTASSWLIYQSQLHEMRPLTNEAIKWRMTAARQGHALAQMLIANELYGKCENEPSIEYESFQWYLKAAEQGDVNAQMIISGFYADGISIYLEADEDKSEYWLEKAADNGNRNAGEWLLLTQVGSFSVIDEEDNELEEFNSLSTKNGDSILLTDNDIRILKNAVHFYKDMATKNESFACESSDEKKIIEYLNDFFESI